MIITIAYKQITFFRKFMNYVFNTNSIYSPSSSLENLDNILNHYQSLRNATEQTIRLTIIKVNTDDFDCGFAIIIQRDDVETDNNLLKNHTTCYLTGNGFRNENYSGEGPRAYADAMKLLEGYNIHEVTLKRPMLSKLKLSFDKKDYPIYSLIIEAVDEKWAWLNNEI
jgi:hypothetical protein